MLRTKQNIKNSRKLNRTYVLALSLLFVVVIEITGIVAFMMDSTEELINIFEPSKVTTSVSEEFKNGVKSGVKIKNTGTTNAWIRANVVISWQDNDGKVYGSKSPDSGTDYEIVYDSTGNWIEGSDGFYYYKNPVPPSGTTNNLINRCEIINSDNTPEGYNLCVEIICSGIQSDPPSVFNDNWGKNSNLEVDADGKSPSLVDKTGGTS